MSKHRDGVDRFLEQAGSLVAFLRVLRGDDPKHVEEQTRAVLERTGELRQQMHRYMGEDDGEGDGGEGA